MHSRSGWRRAARSSSATSWQTDQNDGSSVTVSARDDRSSTGSAPSNRAVSNGAMAMG